MGDEGLDISYCVVNTNGREYLLACLDAIERTHPPALSREVLVLDNCSEDGSVDAVRASGHEPRLIELDRRTGKAENDSMLLASARGRLCLLLNEDSQLCDGATAALVDALEGRPAAGVAAPQLLSTTGEPKACAWRLPGLATAMAGALLLHRRLTVQSRGTLTRSVGWAQSSAMLVRRDAAQSVGWLDPEFFVYSDETDFCKRLHDAGWDVLFVPSARAVHHDQLSTDAAAARRRIVEFHRNRDLYLRKHASPAVRLTSRLLGAWQYVLLAGVATVTGRKDASRLLLHARQELQPARGSGIREAAERFNRGRPAPSARPGGTI